MPGVCVGRAVIFLYGCSLPRLMFYYTICQFSVKTAYSYSVISALIISLEDM